MSDVLLWTPPASPGQAKAGRPARTYVQQLSADTGCSLEDLPEAIDDREGVAGEGQGDLYWWRDMMMMIINIIYLGILWLLFIWNHITVYELIILERKTWFHIIMRKSLKKMYNNYI